MSRKPHDIVAYMYRSAILCPECVITSLAGGVGGSVERILDVLADLRGIDRQNEHSYDFDTFPKVIFRDALEHGETCDYCDAPLVH